MVKICPNRGHIFKNKLRNTWTAILKYQHFQATNLYLVGRAKDKHKNKNIQEEDRRKFNIGKGI